MANWLAGRPILAVDFDKTLHDGSGDTFPGIGRPIGRVIKAVKKRQQEGWDVILWTCRTGEHLQFAVDWCREHGLEFVAINEHHPIIREMFKDYECGPKVYADEYWDDKAVNVKHIGGWWNWLVALLRTWLS